MATQFGSPTITIVAGAALEPFRRVKLSGSSYVYAGANEACDAVTAERIASGATGAAWHASHSGTVKLEASAAVAAGADLFGTANGRVDDAQAGVPFAKALSAATTSGGGDVIEAILLAKPFEVVSTEYVATSVTKTFFVATAPMKVVGITGRVTVAGTGGAATAVVSKVPSGTAIGSGTALHSGTFNLVGTANTNQALTLSTTASELLLAAGDALAVAFTGTLTSATGVISVGLVTI